LVADLVLRQRQRAAALEPVRLARVLRRPEPYPQVARPAQLGDGDLRLLPRFAVRSVAVLHGAHARALAGPGQDDDGPSPGGERLLVRLVDAVRVVAVDLDRVPAERAEPARVRAGVPAVPGGAVLAETVDVHDRDQVVQAGVAGVLGRLPDRALGQFAVAAEHPDAVGQAFQLARHRHADPDRQALTERAGGHVHPGQAGRRMALQAAAALPERQQLLVGDRARRLEQRVQQG